MSVNQMKQERREGEEGRHLSRVYETWKLDLSEEYCVRTSRRIECLLDRTRLPVPLSRGCKLRIISPVIKVGKTLFVERVGVVHRLPSPRLSIGVGYELLFSMIERCRITEARLKQTR